MKGQKKRKQASMGKCSFCGDTFSKGGMVNHLNSCQQRKMTPLKPSDRGKSKQWDKKIFHLVVEGYKQPQYWMHLEVPADVKLEELDGFLRGIWLECCGHLSAFTINNLEYEQNINGAQAVYPIFGSREKPRSMSIHTGYVLHEGLKFYYEYDFGTTTRLVLRVLSERQEDIKDKSIRLLARNNPPQITCGMCGALARQVCASCSDEIEGWLCDKCAPEHNCGEKRMLPVVNSPRVGMCGYTGE